MSTSRSAILPRIVPAQRTVEGGGFVVHRPFPVPQLSYFDPFLLIDEMGPVDYGPGEAIGAPDHPHRGFETVTYMIEGAFEHADSRGHRGTIRDGDVQWMTAGSGLVHAEMPAADIMERGGRLHGFQIWVNLPRALKMSEPRYQEYDRARLPIIEGGGRWIRVIAGEVEGRRSPIETSAPTALAHLRLAPHAATALHVPAGSNAIVYTIAGAGSLGTTPLRAHDVALLPGAPDRLELSADTQPLDALILAGMPLGEPVARYGPFVMNTREEIELAVDDFRAGRLR
jgi:redox-sensitive bicupin YhaK (pirin superfamily)